MPPRRLERHPLTTLERGTPASFRFEGRPVHGFANEPVAAALYARGTKILSRSMRYHRARGYFCGTGGCTHCFVRLDGVPNVRACEVRCGAAGWAEGQNAFPSVAFDALAVTDWVYPNYLDAPRAFVRPAFLKPVFDRVIRQMAGFGRVPRVPMAQSYHEERIVTEVCVVGAGPAGLAAAISAAEAGRRVLLLEREADLGGRLRFLPTPFHATEPDAPRAEGKAYVEEQSARLRALGVDVRTHTRLFGIYPGLRLAAATPTRLVHVQAQSLVLATGSRDAYRPFPGSDRAGVLLATGALKLVNQYGILPGEDVAIVGAHRDGLLLARDLLACGARIASISDPRLDVGEGPLASDLRRLGIPIQWSTTAVQVGGRRSPHGLFLERGKRRRIGCDAVVLAQGRQAAVELAQQAGCRIEFQDAGGGFQPVVGARQETSVKGVFAAGSITGARHEWDAVGRGRAGGTAAADAVGGAA